MTRLFNSRIFRLISFGSAYAATNAPGGIGAPELDVQYEYNS